MNVTFLELLFHRLFLKPCMKQFKQKMLFLEEHNVSICVTSLIRRKKI